MNSDDAFYDICPSGWRLPTGYISSGAYSYGGDFYNLGTAIWDNYTSHSDYRTALSLPLSGYFYNGQVYDQGSYGRWWSSTPASYNDSNRNSLGSGTYNSGIEDRSSRDTGNSIRCIFSSANTYTVHYDSNGGSGFMDDQAVTINTDATLNPNTFIAPEGKVFVGWNTDYNGSGTSYSDEASVRDLAQAGSEITLYAQWADSIQSITWDTCPIEPTDVVDSRDGTIYKIQRLNDDNCWMLQNLDLDIDSNRTYTPTDTDIPDDWTPSKSTYATNDTTWEWSTTTPESYDPGELYWNGDLNTTLVDSDNYIHSTGDPYYHLGNYYNWTAAVAMNDSSSYMEYVTLVDQSICPAGWTLPRVGSGEDTFTALWNEYGFSGNSINGDNKLWTDPLYFAASGYWNGGLYDVGGYGYFWSPVVYDDYHSFSGYFDTNDYANPNIFSGRDAGYSVRCIARPVSSSVTDIPEGKPKG